jgi:hypothetical protein
MTPTLDVDMREITDDELAFYEEYGWVKLDGLISRELAAKLLSAAEELREKARSSHDAKVDNGRRIVETPDWVAFESAISDTSSFASAPSFQARKIRVDPFYALTFSKAAGRVARQLMNRGRLTDAEVGARYCEDALLYKPPHEPERVSSQMGYHQDQWTFGADRAGGFNLWIALDEVRPEQGAMRFLSGSHREGALGSQFSAGTVVDAYPKLFELYEPSPPLHYQPGDATVHHSYMIHGTPANQTDKPRWSYVPTYVPGDSVMSDDAHTGMRAPHERYPLVEV